MLQERTRCPLCGATGYQVHISFPTIPVVRCADCAMMYSRFTLSAEELGKYYRDGFGGPRHKQGQEVNAKVNLRLLRDLIPFDGISSALDVGTGYGFLLSEMSQAGINATGVELSVSEASFGKRVLRQKIINKPLERAGLKEASFDLVCSFEVLEHCAEPLAFLRELARFVRPGGYMVVMTDNFGGRAARNLGAGFPKWIPHSHISHFTPGTLRSAISKLDELILKRMVTYSPWELWAVMLFRWLTGKTASPEEAFNYEDVLKSEMSGRYRLFHLRRLLNPRWALATAHRDGQGDLMYVVAQRTPQSREMIVKQKRYSEKFQEEAGSADVGSSPASGTMSARLTGLQ